MHYPATAFSANKEKTIIPLKVSQQWQLYRIAEWDPPWHYGTTSTLAECVIAGM